MNTGHTRAFSDASSLIPDLCFQPPPYHLGHDNYFDISSNTQGMNNIKNRTIDESVTENPRLFPFFNPKSRRFGPFSAKSSGFATVLEEWSSLITCELANHYTKAVQASTNSAPPRRIVLTGFMGSGKTTVGPLIAARLGWSFIDVDDAVEAEAGTTIAEIFARHGEPVFRAREHAAIARLAAGDSLVMALGGGAIETEATRALLLTTPGTLLVHLEVELATTLNRCSGTEHIRPILADQANLAARYQRRLPLYRTAHVNISVDALTPEEVVDAILRAAIRKK
jgi:shikimate kinase